MAITMNVDTTQCNLSVIDYANQGFTSVFFITKFLYIRFNFTFRIIKFFTTIELSNNVGLECFKYLRGSLSSLFISKVDFTEFSNLEMSGPMGTMWLKYFDFGWKGDFMEKLLSLFSWILSLNHSVTKSRFCLQGQNINKVNRKWTYGLSGFWITEFYC